MEMRARKYLESYLKSLSDSERQKYSSFSSDYFCGDEDNANICSDLIVQGIKTATCSLKCEYEKYGEKIPEVGHLQVVTDWCGNPTSIIEVTSVTECKYSDVDEEFAFAEGEGDRSLKWWQQAHWGFFSEVCEELKIKPDDSMVLILERFKVVYQSAI
ncbi:ASCH domain-containing protein [Photobacterium alginatilyticum]|uniref:ASCH domain-containing protein n=1 Tax=Photobacterium alginatilyticum TaxID=1775171 RepID=UPI00406908A8